MVANHRHLHPHESVNYWHKNEKKFLRYTSNLAKLKQKEFPFKLIPNLCRRIEDEDHYLQIDGFVKEQDKMYALAKIVKPIQTEALTYFMQEVQVEEDLQLLD